MRKSVYCLLLLLLWSTSALAQAEVFFLPESGFLRVQLEVTMEPGSAAPSFLLFPSAQITELWADELREYNIQRSAHGTVVTLSLQQVRRQTLNLSYEGFLSPRNSEVLLDRDSLWFPEFSFAIESPQIHFTLPDDWSLVSWQSEPPFYPALTVRSTALAAADQPLTETPPLVDPPTRAGASRMQMQVTRLTNSINQRNVGEIEALLSHPLRQAGLGQYLASLPSSYGRVTSSAQDEHTILFSTDRGFRYQASVLWQERGDRLELVSFALTPQGPDLPREVLHSVEEFVGAMRLAVQAANEDRLLSLLNPSIAQGQGDVLQFLLSLNPVVPWTVEYAVLEPFAITVFVPHAERTKLLLNLELSPGQNHWVIDRLEVVPVG
ncbi:MAG: hypothetical protein QM451_04840 [Bacillota bacterium]|jgi:hypothetical protein|nr:hypothetical protein [Bacillota bacterium]HHT91342.1 hypothetical protein [Bacillota bacterium]